MPGLIGAIQIGLTGLRVNETRQLATSNNIANVVTIGFAASEVQASSLNPTRGAPGQGAVPRPHTGAALSGGPILTVIRCSRSVGNRIFSGAGRWPRALCAIGLSGAEGAECANLHDPG